MLPPRERPAARLEEYWGWIAAALFLLVTVDLLTTLYAAAAVGTAAEANPVMAWLLGRDLLTVVAVHLLAVVLVAVLFWGLTRLVAEMPDRVARPFAFLVEVWLGALLAAGLFVFANNLVVVVHGESLL